MDKCLLSRIKEMQRTNPNIGRDEIVKILNAPVQDVRACLLYIRKPELFQDKANCESKYFPNVFPAVEVYTDYLRIETNAIVIAADPHLPLIHIAMADRMIDMSKKFGCKDIAIPGDLFEQAMFSRYDHAARKDEWKIEKTCTQKFLERLCELFERVFICCGNHDIRIIRLLENKWDFEDFVLTLFKHPNLKVSNQPRMIINGEWRVIHPKNYSTIRTRVPGRKSLLEEQSCISSHGHHAGVAPSDNNRHVSAEACVLCDPRKVGYLANSETLHPKWVPGFNILYKNTIYQFTDNPLMTDWDFWDKWKGVKE